MTAPMPNAATNRTAGPARNAPLLAAEWLLAQPHGRGGAGWARNVVLLARQALEDAIEEFWTRRSPGMEQATGRSRLVSLRFYVDDPTLARLAEHTWCTLSDASHYHAYDLAPTAGELRSWLDTVADIVGRLGTGTHDLVVEGPPVTAV